MTLKILTIDIERLQGMALLWETGQQFVGIDQFVEPARTCCVAGKWYGKKSSLFTAEWQDKEHDWLRDVWEWLDEADVVITFNGKRFDIPILQWDFVERGWEFPSPYHHVDLYQLVKGLKPASKKLAYLTEKLEVAPKMRTSSGLWYRVRNGDRKAQAEMRKYNIQDIVSTEDLYDYLKPYVKLPNMAMLSGLGQEDGMHCPQCSTRLVSKGTDYVHDGYHATGVSVFQRIKCLHCGRRSHNGKAILRAGQRPI